MKYSPLGTSGLEVSRICLGTMTWGTQNTQADADQQLEYALSQGINFIDTAEMYSVPPTPQSYGATESIIGNWLQRHPEKRSDIILATKIAGVGLSYIRGGSPITGASVIEAVDASLQRLQTDYIDLYQLHWPNRTTPHFGKHHLNKVPFSTVNAEEHKAGMLDILQGLDSCVKAGKIRHCGLSDDSPWGIAEYLQLAKEHSLPRMVSIQNEFSLIHTKDWPYLIEQCAMEDVAFLPWSPLGGGVLSGKYLNGAMPEGSRWSFTQRNGIFRDTEQVHRAVAAYATLADSYQITPAQLALAWCDRVDGVTSTIIGATTMEQLKEDIAAFSVPYSDELAEQIAEIKKQFPEPY